MNTLENIIDEIIQHDIDHPDHGRGCACHDKHAGAIRRLIHEKGIKDKSLHNLMTVFSYILR